jgi:hypothetical protein
MAWVRLGRGKVEVRLSRVWRDRLRTEWKEATGGWDPAGLIMVSKRVVRVRRC